MKREMFLFTLLILVMFMLPINIEYDIKEISIEKEFKSSDTTEEFSFTVGALSWYWIKAIIYNKAGQYGSFTVESGKDIDFFVCDENAKNRIDGGEGGVPVLKNWGEVSGTYTWKVILPTAENWYFCFSNYDSLISTVHIDATFSFDTTPPNINIISPSYNQRVSDTVLFSATASDAHFNVIQMRIYVDNVLKKTTSGNSIQYNWDSNQLSDGSHNVKFEADDEIGNTQISTRTIEVDNYVAPIITTPIPETDSPTTPVSETDNPTRTSNPVGLGNPLSFLILILIIGLVSVIGINIYIRKGEKSSVEELTKVLILCPYCGKKYEQGLTICPNCQGG